MLSSRNGRIAVVNGGSLDGQCRRRSRAPGGLPKRSETLCAVCSANSGAPAHHQRTQWKGAGRLPHHRLPVSCASERGGWSRDHGLGRRWQTRPQTQTPYEPATNPSYLELAVYLAFPPRTTGTHRAPLRKVVKSKIRGPRHAAARQSQPISTSLRFAETQHLLPRHPKWDADKHASCV